MSAYRYLAEVRAQRIDAADRMTRWLASNRFHTPDNIPSPEMQDRLEKLTAKLDHR
jgi:hypothetical protein